MFYVVEKTLVTKSNKLVYYFYICCKLDNCSSYIHRKNSKYISPWVILQHVQMRYESMLYWAVVGKNW